MASPACTEEELENIISVPIDPCMDDDDQGDLVWPQIYIGNGETAKDLHQLRLLKITHVLNCAEGPVDQFCVDTSPAYYARTSIKYKGVPGVDIMNYDMTAHFQEAADFIHQAVTEGGIVYVHCVCGVSRAPTIVLSYLLIHQRLSLQEAARAIRAKREICPNPGFLQQLCRFYQRLVDNGHYK